MILCLYYEATDKGTVQLWEAFKEEDIEQAEYFAKVVSGMTVKAELDWDGMTDGH